MLISRIYSILGALSPFVAMTGKVGNLIKNFAISCHVSGKEHADDLRLAPEKPRTMKRYQNSKIRLQTLTKSWPRR